MSLHGPLHSKPFTWNVLSGASTSQTIPLYNTEQSELKNTDSESCQRPLEPALHLSAAPASQSKPRQSAAKLQPSPPTWVTLHTTSSPSPSPLPQHIPDRPAATKGKRKNASHHSPSASTSKPKPELVRVAIPNNSHTPSQPHSSRKPTSPVPPIPPQ
ncbi:hypothetical protein FIBSPDRAFT_882489 [Athelia psychrophila]|uniref:Uncharacterized protein n=1 Tax=Athelia psychrophila TaxID=1759441 RepID=A0A166VER9_9AGAM|nr:hypothetical protein FIBSPDRAFT_882489 [Fibularhizoctonia sp. CBS 109695]